MDLVKRIISGDRQALAKAITLIESYGEHDQALKLEVLSRLSGNPHSLRLAVSGPPGVGKSTFINIIGQKLLAHGFRIAVLPIDPSSTINHGSILGDKMRMGDLLAHDDVFIRPSPSGGLLGGVALATRDVMIATEASGFSCIIIETVGVGQSETLARMLSDYFIVLMQPGAGDQLQAMKKGILELADYVLVNKADGPQESLATQAKNALKTLSLGAHTRHPYIDTISSLTGSSLDSVVTHLITSHQQAIKSGDLSATRLKKREDYFKISLIDHMAQALAKTAFTRGCFDSKDTRKEISLLPEIQAIVDALTHKLS